MEKEFQYAQKIQFHLSEIFNEDCEYFIDRKEFNEDDNATAFIHALANIVPGVIYNKLTGNEVNNLEFNHIANTLCFQFSTKEDDQRADV